MSAAPRESLALRRDLLRFAYAGPGVKRWHITRLCMYRTVIVLHKAARAA